MSELSDLAADLRRAGDSALDEGKKVVAKGSLNVKTRAREIIAEASDRGYLPHYPASITYETTPAADSVTGHIGPEEDRRQGPLGSILEDGSVNNAPIPHLGPALDEEEPQFEEAAAELGERLLERQ